ncbi:alpha-mannosidase [Marinilabilia sp.]
MNNKVLKYKMKNIYRVITNYLMLILLTSISINLYSQASTASKPEVDPIDPHTIDLTKPTLFLMPYTHLDDIWRWSYPQTIRDFLKNTLDDNFEAFEKYPNYVFNWSGASRYQMMKEYYPEKYKELKEWVAAGRWYPSGTSWVENDVLVPSSEAIIRQILMGTRYFETEFDRVSHEYMIPDCFGFSWALPSILHHCGVKGFSTQKLTWESANGIPFNIGRWTGPDGNGVIAALNAGNYAVAHNEVYNNHEKTLKRLNANRDVCGLPIDFYYVGGGDLNNADRGGVIQNASLEAMEKMSEAEGPVNVVIGKADLMFNAITDEQAEKFPVWNKDLLLVKHSTGVLTSQAYTKKLNRNAELLADATERASVSANLIGGFKYPFQSLNKAWELVLRNQFHDNLPGTSIPKAHEQGWNDGIVALNKLGGVYEDAIGTLAKTLNTNVPGVAVVVFNPLSIARTDYVEANIPDELKGAASIAVFDAKGKEVPSQITAGYDGIKRLLFQAELPAIGGAVFSFREGEPQKQSTGLFVNDEYLENSHYKVNIDNNGDISSIYDKKLKKELLEKPVQLEFIEDFPETKPAWRIYYKDLSKPPRSVATNPISLKIVENGPVRVAIEVVRENEGSLIKQRIRLYSGKDASRVEVNNQVDWKSRGTLLKAAFHLTASAPEATYNLDLGTIKRGNRTENQYEVPHHGWLDLTDNSGTYGSSILTGYKYGSDKVDDNTIRLTLIHGPDTKDSQQEVLDDGTMSEQRWQDWGRHEFSYAITGHKGDWRDGNTHWEAMRFEQRPVAFAVPKHKGKRSIFSLLNISSDQVNIQAVKMAENGSGVVVRLQELYGKECEKVKLSALLPIEDAEFLDGAERPLNGQPSAEKGQLSLNFAPYELKTILLKMPEAKELTDLTQPLTLEYDADVISYNDNVEDGYDEAGFTERRSRKEGHRGSFDGKGGTYPGEMMGNEIVMGNVTFKIGPSGVTEYNAVECMGQDIQLPEGTKVLHILAAADVDTDVIFKAGEKEFPLTIGGWTGNLGCWDNREFEGYVAELSYSMRNNLKTIHPAYYRNQRVAWAASHHHRPTGDALYEYSYMFAYRLEIPDGATSITLPNARFVRILAMSIGDENHAKALHSPFNDLYRDNLFRERFNKPTE